MSYNQVKKNTDKSNATLVAVSKTKPSSSIMDLYNLGQRHFGENRVQEMIEKHDALPKDILWHQIGTLQKNKVKYIAPFVHLIHSVDSLKLAETIVREAEKNKRCIDILVQIKVAQEATKHGITQNDTNSLIEGIIDLNSSHIRLSGIMAMASFTEDQEVLKMEFLTAKESFESVRLKYFKNNTQWNTLSMGMSSDYLLALECGSNMVRVGSLIFGSRD